jgi:hypothetical protein
MMGLRCSGKQHVSAFDDPSVIFAGAMEAAAAYLAAIPRICSSSLQPLSWKSIQSAIGAFSHRTGATRIE